MIKTWCNDDLYNWSKRVRLAALYGFALIIFSPCVQRGEENISFGPANEGVSLLVYSDELMHRRLPTSGVVMVLNHAKKDVVIHSDFWIFEMGMHLLSPDGRKYKVRSGGRPAKPQNLKEVREKLITLRPGQAFGVDLRFPIERLSRLLMEQIPSNRRRGEWMFQLYIFAWHPWATQEDGVIKLDPKPLEGPLYSKKYAVRLK